MSLIFSLSVSFSPLCYSLVLLTRLHQKHVGMPSFMSLGLPPSHTAIHELLLSHSVLVPIFIFYFTTSSPAEARRVVEKLTAMKHHCARGGISEPADKAAARLDSVSRFNTSWSVAIVVPNRPSQPVDSVPNKNRKILSLSKPMALFRDILFIFQNRIVGVIISRRNSL